jgi:RNA polymerase primary sigma factor
MTATVSVGGSFTYTSDELAWWTVEALQLLLGERSGPPPLRSSDEAELVERSGRGDREARRQLVETNLVAVAAAARRSEAAALPVLDRLQQGILGLLGAVATFEPRGGGGFAAHAERSIREALGQALSVRARTVGIPLALAESERRLGRAERALTAQLGRPPRDYELAAEAGISIAQLHATRQAISTIASRQRSDGDEDDVARVELELELTDATLRQAAAALPEVERQVLVLRYGIEDGAPRGLSDASRALGMPRGELVALEEKALERLELEREIRALRSAA